MPSRYWLWNLVSTVVVGGFIRHGDLLIWLEKPHYNGENFNNVERMNDYERYNMVTIESVPNTVNRLALAVGETSAVVG